MEREFSSIRQAQLQGRQRAVYGGRSFNINDMGAVPQTNMKCEEILGKEKCKILFNACDPVVCPRSRCNLGGQYNEIGPSGVIGSGLVGSLFLCLPNIQEERGGVLVPICLSGILASLKGIKSHLESYVQCLENQKVNGVSTGICDQMRSIFICSLIWREALTLLAAKGALINFFSGGEGAGGGEYFQNGIGGSLQEANEVTSFLINDYADDVFSAYRGKGLPEIGAEVCKASIAQRIPFIDALVQEFGTPENPPQFTAYFEESPFAPTLGKSQYKVYYHVYGGTPRRDTRLQYLVYLKSFGSSPRIVVNSGSLGPGQSADETIDMVADTGYQEICVVLNGLEQCGFGRIVSSSVFLSTMDDYLTSIDLSKGISTSEQCKADATVPVSYTLTTGALPYARIKRVCSLSNPGVGVNEERFWRKAGSCGQDSRGVSLGDCWEFADTKEFSETEKQALEVNCGGQVCESNQECLNNNGQGKVTYLDSRGRICCEIGSCVSPDSTNLVGKYERESSSLNEKDIKIIKEVQFNEEGEAKGDFGTLGIKEILDTKADDAYFKIGLQYCNAERNNEGNVEYQFKICKGIFLSKIKEDNKNFAKSRLVLGLKTIDHANGLDKLNDDKLNEIEGYLNDANKKRETLDENDKKILDNKLIEIANERKARKTRLDELKKQSEEDKLKQEQEKISGEIQEGSEDILAQADAIKFQEFLQDVDNLIKKYSVFTDITPDLQSIKGNMQNAIKTNKFSTYTSTLTLASSKLSTIKKVQVSTKYISVSDLFDKALENIQSENFNNARNRLVAIKSELINWDEGLGVDWISLDEAISKLGPNIVDAEFAISKIDASRDSVISILQDNGFENLKKKIDEHIKSRS